MWNRARKLDSESLLWRKLAKESQENRVNTFCDWSIAIMYVIVTVLVLTARQCPKTATEAPTKPVSIRLPKLPPPVLPLQPNSLPTAITKRERVIACNPPVRVEKGVR